MQAFRTRVRFELVLVCPDARSLAVYNALSQVIASLAHGSAVAGKRHQAE
ncbi:hypothetical protein [Hymenobacter nivis]|nr:hypothetical protein [Hymenobacter nivis]